MRVVLLLALLASACASRPRTGVGEIHASVTAADGKSGVACQVEINSMPGFFSGPITVPVKTGGEFKHEMETTGSIRNMYAAIRCEGYGTRVSRTFELEPGSKIDLGNLVVSRE